VPAAVVLAAVALSLALWSALDCAVATGALRQAVAAPATEHTHDGTMLETAEREPVAAAAAGEDRATVRPAAPEHAAAATAHVERVG